MIKDYNSFHETSRTLIFKKVVGIVSMKVRKKTKMPTITMPIQYLPATQGKKRNSSHKDWKGGNKIIILYDDLIVFIENWKEITNKLLDKKRVWQDDRYKQINNSFILFTSNNQLETFIFKKMLFKSNKNLEINLIKYMQALYIAHCITLLKNALRNPNKENDIIHSWAGRFKL